MLAWRQRVDAELEELLGGADALVELADEVNLDNVTGEGAEVGRGVIGVDLNALELTLDLSNNTTVQSSGTLLTGNAAFQIDGTTAANGVIHSPLRRVCVWFQHSL